MHAFKKKRNTLSTGIWKQPQKGCDWRTCPEGQAQHCLVHGILQTEVWNDLEVVGGMKRVGCNPSSKGGKKGSRYISESCIRCILKNRWGSILTFLLEDDRDHIWVVVSDGHVEGGLHGNTASVVG